MSSRANNSINQNLISTNMFVVSYLKNDTVIKKQEFKTLEEAIENTEEYHNGKPEYFEIVDTISDTIVEEDEIVYDEDILDMMFPERKSRGHDNEEEDIDDGFDIDDFSNED